MIYLKLAIPISQEHDNAHRLRAACVEILEESTAEGHTLLFMENLMEASRYLPIVHKIPLDAEMVDICRDDFKPVISVIGNEENMMVQLERYVASGKLIRSAVDERLKNVPKTTKVNWRKLVDEKFRNLKKGDIDEDRARNEKAAALEILGQQPHRGAYRPGGDWKDHSAPAVAGAKRDCRDPRATDSANG